MQEKHVTVAGATYTVDEPFMVLATQNPLEMEGTYPLPEAQLDRFLFKLRVTYPTAEDLHTILDRTTEAGAPRIARVLDAADIVAMRQVVRDVPMTREIQAYAIHLVLATHGDNAAASSLARKFVRYGASPRGVQALILAARFTRCSTALSRLPRGHREGCAAGFATPHHPEFRRRGGGTTSEDILREILAQAGTSASK